MSTVNKYYEHVTIQGERWDQLAYRYYGSALAYAVIVRANPYVPITPLLPAGTVLRIPIPEDGEEFRQLNSGGQPPWRQ